MWPHRHPHLPGPPCNLGADSKLVLYHSGFLMFFGPVKGLMKLISHVFDLAHRDFFFEDEELSPVSVPK